jgi:hypothetical protein
MNIIGFLAVIAASVVMLVKTSVSSKFFFFDAVTHVLTAVTSSEYTTDFAITFDLANKVHSVSSCFRVFSLPRLLRTQLASPQSGSRIRDSSSCNDCTRNQHAWQPQQGGRQSRISRPCFLAPGHRIWHPHLHPRLDEPDSKLRLPRPQQGHHRPPGPRPRCSRHPQDTHATERFPLAICARAGPVIHQQSDHSDQVQQSFPHHAIRTPRFDPAILSHRLAHTSVLASIPHTPCPTTRLSDEQVLAHDQLHQEEGLALQNVRSSECRTAASNQRERWQRNGNLITYGRQSAVCAPGAETGQCVAPEPDGRERGFPLEDQFVGAQVVWSSR